MGLVLLTTAAALLVPRRLRRSVAFLCAYLAVVGGNYVFTAAQGATQDAAWSRLALLLLALDPLFLALFVGRYPYPPPRAWRKAMVGAAAALGGAALSILLLWPASTFAGTKTTLGAAVAVLNMALVYMLAWVASVRSVVRAPTPLLRRRAVWVAVAVGCAVVPRLGLLPLDFNFHEVVFAAVAGQSGGATVPQALAAYAALAGLGGFLMTLGLAAAWLHAERTARDAGAADARRVLRLVALVSGSLLVVHVIFQLAWVSTHRIILWGAAYGFRWVVFAGLLGYSLFRYEDADLPPRARRGVAVLGGLLGAVGLFLVALAYAQANGIGLGLGVPVAAAVGLAAALPSAHVTAAAVRYLDAGIAVPPGVSGRYESYRAAVEDGWARGPPDAEGRARLERHRKEAGLSAEEARAIAFAVASSRPDAPARIETGDEVWVGVVAEKLLGEGAHGRVFLARRAASGETVVVKEMRTGPGQDEDGRRRFFAETDALRRVSNPHVVRLLDAHASPGRYLLLLEPVDARPLASLVRRGGLPPGRVASLLRQTLDGLAAAHAAGLIHRDLKPSNLLVGHGDHVWITDFGLAATPTPAPPTSGTASRLRPVVGAEGTLAYMAPEQVNAGRLGVPTDLYATGLIGYELLTGRPALDVAGFPPGEAVGRVARPSIDLDRVPPAWRAFFAKALDPDPARRFQAASLMSEGLPDDGRRGGATATTGRPGTSGPP